MNVCNGGVSQTVHHKGHSTNLERQMGHAPLRRGRRRRRNPDAHVLVIPSAFPPRRC